MDVFIGLIEYLRSRLLKESSAEKVYGIYDVMENPYISRGIYSAIITAIEASRIYSFHVLTTIHEMTRNDADPLAYKTAADNFLKEEFERVRLVREVTYIEHLTAVSMSI